MTVLQDQPTHKHICPICNKVYYCTESECTDSLFTLCDECTEND